MQKVRSFLLELLIKLLFIFLSLTVLFTIAYVLYLVFEEGSPYTSNSLNTVLIYRLIYFRSRYL